MEIGKTIRTSPGLSTAPKYAKSIGCDIFQIFLGAPCQIISKKKNTAELVKFGEDLEKYNIRMVVHGSYTINLCHPINSTKFESSIRSLVQDLDAVKIIGKNCLGVIIHMGKNIKENSIDNEIAIENYIAGIKKALSLSDPATTIILETGASQGTEVGSSLGDLADIYWSLKKSERKRVQICVDTCHIWATGYDISDKAGVNKFFKKFEKYIGIENIACIHFNDSKTDLQSCVDRHDDLGYGKIGNEGLMQFALKAKKYNIPLITETPLSNFNKKTKEIITFKDELKKIKSWIE